MKQPMYFGGVALVLAFALIYVQVANAQNLTTNVSNAMGNASASANQTAAIILNKTGEVGKKIVGGADDVASNISGEIKQGVGAK